MIQITALWPHPICLINCLSAISPISYTGFSDYPDSSHAWMISLGTISSERPGESIDAVCHILKVYLMYITNRGALYLYVTMLISLVYLVKESDNRSSLTHPGWSEGIFFDATATVGTRSSQDCKVASTTRVPCLYQWRRVGW